MFHFRRNKDTQLVEISISSRTVIKVLALIIVWFLVLAALRKASHAILLIFTAFFLALALNAPVHWLAQNLPGKRRGNRTLATGISFLVVMLLLIGFLASIVPPLIRQTNTFIQAAPHLIEDLHNQNSSLGRFVQAHNLGGTVDKLSSQLSGRLQNISGSTLSTVTGITSSIFSMLTVIVLTFMMLIEGPRWLKLAYQLIPEENQKHARHLARNMYQVIRGYVNGQILLATIVAVLIVVPLLIFNISYPIALMVIVFICGLIPLVGHSIGAAIVTAVALFHSPLDAVIILAYYILYMQIEAYVIQPKIQADSTNLSPLLVFGSVIVGVSFGGLFGGLVAIPVVGCLRVLVVDYITTHSLLRGDVEEELPATTVETK